MSTNLGNTLRFLREEHEKTQIEIGELLNVTSQTYSNYELGYRQPDLFSLLRLAQFYNIDVSLLFSEMLNSAQCVNFAIHNSPQDYFNHTFTDDEFKLLYLYRSLPSEAQQDILTFTKIKANRDL